MLDAIQRDNVTLVTDGIRRINETGIETVDGTQHDVDVIVYATGFHASEYLFPMTVTGRGGRTLEEFWKRAAPAPIASAWFPGFPNLWSVYGPNTNGGLGPGAFHELVTRYALAVHGAPDPRGQAGDRADRGGVLALQRGRRRAQRAQGLERPAVAELLLDRARALGRDVPVHRARRSGASCATRRSTSSRSAEENHRTGG